jgi:cell division protein FtsL
MPEQQNFSHHARFDPLVHFFLFPVALIVLIAMIYRAVTGPSLDSGLHVVIALWAVVAGLKIRLYALKVQDRIIRLEERLRLKELLPANLQSRIGDLTESQLIGLRFASDGELTDLVQKTLDQKLEQKQIKQAVKNWRPDFWRV